MLDRLLEVERLGGLHEADRVTRGAAAEAVVQPVLGVHRERRRALVVERAEARVARSDPSQIGARANELDHVDRVLDPIDRVSRVKAHDPGA